MQGQLIADQTAFKNALLQMQVQLTADLAASQAAFQNAIQALQT